MEVRITEPPPEPKRQKIDESILVPEDQFLAQHPGLETLMVYVPSINFGKFIEFTIESSSETVACLKEKIAAAYSITADRVKLSGKAGFLEDDTKSLAYYNVVAGEILTLDMENVIQSKEMLFKFLLGQG